jgi:hypothetical protein
MNATNLLALALLTVTGCAVESSNEQLATSKAALTYHAPLSIALARVADASVDCAKGLQLNAVAYDECRSAGGSDCEKSTCAFPSATLTGNEIASAEVSYAGIIGPEIAGIIGPEIAGIIGPELPTVATLAGNAKTFRVKLLDGSGKTLVARTLAHKSFAADLEAIRSTLRDKPYADPQTVQLFYAY